MQKRSLGSNGPPGKCFNLQCWVNTKALDWEELFWSQLAGSEQVRIFWAQGHHCTAARASLSEKHQHQPRNKCHFFPFLFLLFPEPLALLTCPPDLITGCKRSSSVWIWFPKGKMTYFSQWVSVAFWSLITLQPCASVSFSVKLGLFYLNELSNL